MDQYKYIYISLILLITAADAVRDAYIERLAPWWCWHFIKWLGFFPPIVAILYLIKADLITVIYLAFTCSVLWNIVYKYFTWRQK